MAPLQVYLALSGSIQKLHSIELVDGETGQRLGESAFHTLIGDGPIASTSAIFYRRQLPPKKLIVRLGHFDKTEMVTIPFDLTTGIGL